VAAGTTRRWPGRIWRRVRGVSDRTSLRTKLVASLLALVLVALAAMALAGTSILRGYLLSPYDSALQSQGTQVSAASCLQRATSGFGQCPSQADVYWIATGSSPQSISQNGSGYYLQQGNFPPPNLTGISSWLAAHPGQPVTVPATSGGDRWRIVGYTEKLTENNVTQTGTLVVAYDVTTVYSTIHRLTVVDIIVSAVIVFVLAVVGFIVVQTNLRPLVEIEETAGEIAEGHLNRRVPERDRRTEIGSLGNSLNTMLSQIETAFHAREQSEQAAHQSEERMRRFIGDASHELRTPLTAIRGFAEYYRQRGGLVQQWDDDESARVVHGGLSPEDLDRIMHRVEAEAARMGLLVEDLLMLARMDQQRPLASNPVDLLSLAADAVHDTRMLAPDRTIELLVQPGAAFLVLGDEPRLRQVIGNLMSNALTHTPDGTAIEVSIGSGVLDPPAQQPVPAVLLAVQDHGPGMTSEQADRVFERFYRADQARGRNTGGSGLGLSIVAALVTAHGGVASVQTAPGQGATFRVALPLAPEAQGWAEDHDQEDAPVETAQRD
jgi:two-component system OmpR family sensor kinase